MFGAFVRSLGPWAFPPLGCGATPLVVRPRAGGEQTGWSQPWVPRLAGALGSFPGSGSSCFCSSYGYELTKMTDGTRFTGRDSTRFLFPILVTKLQFLHLKWTARTLTSTSCFMVDGKYFWKLAHSSDSNHTCFSVELGCLIDTHDATFLPGIHS